MVRPHVLPALAVVALLLTGCGDQREPPAQAHDPVAAPTSTTPTPAEAGDPALPEVVEWDGEGSAPPITLDLDGRRVPLKPWTACYENGCYDGWDPGPYFDVGHRDAVAFSFPDKGWEFEATFRETGKHMKCGRQITLPVRKTSARTWVVEPIGPAGDWDVDLFGRGNGDVITTFHWSTDTDGKLPGPATGSAAVLADNDDALDSYGVEIGVRDLASQPKQASAQVTVTSADDRSVTIPTKLERPCFDEGSLWFTAPDDAGRRATELGEGPFAYVVKLELDGKTYTGRGEWPTGETEEIAPHVPLTWTPALPSYSG